MIARRLNLCHPLNSAENYRFIIAKPVFFCKYNFFAGIFLLQGAGIVFGAATNREGKFPHNTEIVSWKTRKKYLKQRLKMARCGFASGRKGERLKFL